ncbi:MAG: hypothetical protein Q7T05_04000 [Dehalococcoidia bacterium]|nr:hypothetical protein [Dehalococcoidia bacterium]
MQCKRCLFREYRVRGKVVCPFDAEHNWRDFDAECDFDAERLAALEEQIGEEYVVVRRELLAYYLNECQWARTGEVCAGEITGCCHALECRATRIKLEDIVATDVSEAV